MKLVSAEEALRAVEIGRPTGMGNSQFIALAETVVAFWPIVEWAARQPCIVQNGPCEVWLDDRRAWCSRCLARKLDKEAKP